MKFRVCVAISYSLQVIPALSEIKALSFQILIQVGKKDTSFSKNRARNIKIISLSSEILP